MIYDDTLVRVAIGNVCSDNTRIIRKKRSGIKRNIGNIDIASGNNGFRRRECVYCSNPCAERSGTVP